MATISNPLSFRDAGRFQRVCAVCGSTGEYEVHHVVSKQRLKKEGLLHRVYDPRNALRLCKYDRRCHMNSEHGGVNKVTIRTSQLTPDNICFLWETLGMAGQNYLERHYTGVDRRFTLHVEGRCPLCQASH